MFHQSSIWCAVDDIYQILQGCSDDDVSVENEMVGQIVDGLKR